MVDGLARVLASCGLNPPDATLMLSLHHVPGLPDANLQPPTIAEAGDPFAELRVVHLVARLDRGTPVRVRDIVDRLNAEHVDWSFSRGVVIGAVVQLQANWLSDFRSASGIEVRDGVAGPELVVEDTARIEPWLVRQVTRLSAACTERLRVFAVEEGAIP